MSRLSDVFKTVAELRNGDLRAELVHMRAQNAALESRNERHRVQNQLLLFNMREMADAFKAMRADLNELFPIQSEEADLLNGPEFSVACEAIVTAARAAYDRATIIEECAAVIDRLNREGPYMAIAGAREIRKLKGRPT